MTTLFKQTLALGLILTVMACKTQNTATAETLESETNTEKFDSTGYTAAEIVMTGKGGDCEMMLQLKNDNNTMLDPVNMDDKFKKADTKVWVKYTLRRQPPRCGNITVASITEITARQQ